MQISILLFLKFVVPSVKQQKKAYQSTKNFFGIF